LYPGNPTVKEDSTRLVIQMVDFIDEVINGNSDFQQEQTVDISTQETGEMENRAKETAIGSDRLPQESELASISNREENTKNGSEKLNGFQNQETKDGWQEKKERFRLK